MSASKEVISRSWYDFYGHRRAETGAAVSEAPFTSTSDFNDRRVLLILGLCVP